MSCGIFAQSCFCSRSEEKGWRDEGCDDVGQAENEVCTGKVY